MKTQFIGFILSIVFGLVGCSSGATVYTPTTGSSTSTPAIIRRPTTVVPTSAPTIQFAFASSTPSPTAALARIGPTATTGIPSSAIKPPSGVVYRTADGLWQVNDNGDSVLLVNLSKGSSAALSPDGNRLLYGVDADPSDQYSVSAQQSNRYSVIDLLTKTETELKPDSKYAVCDATWWKMQPSTILAMVQPIAEVGGMVCQGIPALFSLNGKPFSTIGSEPTEYYSFAASPDGKAIAFDQGGVPWLYHEKKGATPLDLAGYGFPKLTEAFFSNPAWSPGGHQLAWVIAGKLGNEERQGIGVFNLQDRSSRFLFPYEVEGFDGGRSYIVWSSDEKHFAVWNFGKDLMWVLAVNEIGPRLTESASNPVWSPNGKLLVYTGQNRNLKIFSPKDQSTKPIGNGTPIKWNPNSQQLIFVTNDHSVQLLDVNQRNVQHLDLPRGATVLEWLQTQH